MNTIYKNDWLEIFENEGTYTIRYDSGDIGGTVIERAITQEEAIRAQESAEAITEILNKYDNIELFGEDYMNR